MKRFVILSLLVVLLGVSTAWGYAGKFFFVFNWDGMRYDGLDSCTYIPDSLAAEEIFFDHLYNAWHTMTTPGHANIHTGNPQWFLNVRVRTTDLLYDHYLPSLLEAYVKEKGSSAADSVKAWFFGSSRNDKAWGFSRHPNYRNIHAARDIQDGLSDTTLWKDVIKPNLDTLAPGIIYVDFHEVDRKGHEINTPADLPAYYNAIKTIDSLTYHIIKKYIQDTTATNKYRDSTNVLIISDHGRHTDGVRVGLKKHGCDCDGCRHVIGFLWGPDFVDGDTVTNYTYQTDFAHTIAHILGLYAPHARTSEVQTGWLSSAQGENLFNPGQGQTPLSDDSVTSSRPDVAVGKNGRVHVVWCRDNHVIKYRYKDLSGNWSQTATLNNVVGAEEMVAAPKIAAFSDTVAACWPRYTQKSTGFRAWYLDVRYSTNGGQSWNAVQRDVLDSAVVNADLVVGKEISRAYVLLAAHYAADRAGGTRMVTVHKDTALAGNWVRKLRSRVANVTPQNVYLEATDARAVLSFEAVDKSHRNFEIGKYTSKDHGDRWSNPRYVTDDQNIGSNYLKNDYFPSCVVCTWDDGGKKLIAPPIAGQFSFKECYPNPFNPVTVISYNLPEVSKVRLEVFNLQGQKVATLVDEEQQTGPHAVTWHARDYGSGLYFYRLTAGEHTVKRKMLLLK